MIRINLLPIKQQRRRTAGRTQIVVFAALVVLEVLVLGLLYMTQTSNLEQIQTKVAQNENDVKLAKAEVKDAEQLEAQKDQLEQQLKVLDELQKLRSGPVKVLDELQEMLSPPRSPEARFSQLQKNWNVEWDTRRLWVEKLGEKGGTFNIEGGAVNADDVAEFLQRLSTGKYFYDVELDIVKQASSNKNQARTVTFILYGKLSYTGRPEQKKTKPAAKPGKGS